MSFPQHTHLKQRRWNVWPAAATAASATMWAKHLKQRGKLTSTKQSWQWTVSKFTSDGSDADDAPQPPPPLPKPPPLSFSLATNAKDEEEEEDAWST